MGESKSTDARSTVAEPLSTKASPDNSHLASITTMARRIFASTAG
jgi:hypothetical protein